MKTVISLSQRHKLLLGVFFYKPRFFGTDLTLLSLEAKSTHIPDVCPNGNSMTQFRFSMTLIAVFVDVEFHRLRFVIPELPTSATVPGDA